MRDFLRVDDFSREELIHVLDRADALQVCWMENKMPCTLSGAKVALWFYGNGFRNRMAFELGARSMGADLSFVPGELGVNEPIEDIGRYLDNWFSLLIIRAKRQADLLRVAADAKAPVINARTEFNHPCEILGDLLYIRKQRGSLEGLEVVFSGEVSNLCMSWFEAARVLPIRVTQVAPREYLLPENDVGQMNAKAAGRISVSSDLESAVTAGTELIYTDCWPKSGDRAEIEKLFLPYQITEAVLSRMGRRGIFLPCPPVTRGQEVSAEAMLSGACRNYDAKECLLHAQNAVMEFIMLET